MSTTLERRPKAKHADIAHVICPYCDNPAKLMRDSSPIYRGRNYGPVWICEPCDAWVGVHRDSRQFKPYGRLANAALRSAKILAHTAFDPLWEDKMKMGMSKHAARNGAYDWLAGAMGINRGACHIGYFNEAQCGQVVALCLKRKLQA